MTKVRRGTETVRHLQTTLVTAREDSVDKMWSAYMEEAEKHDERVSDAWRDDAEGVLVFVSPNTEIHIVQRNDMPPRMVFFPPP